MKRIIIERITTKVIERALRTKKINTIEFTFLYNDGNSVEYTVINLNKYAFKLRIPFSYYEISLTNFEKVTVEKQNEAIKGICDKYTGVEVEIGTYDNNYIDLEIEEALIHHIKNDMIMIPSYGKIYDAISKEIREIEMYADYNVFTPFATTLKEYYKNNGEIEFDMLLEASKYNF